jgi:hypothetical protein
VTPEVQAQIEKALRRPDGWWVEAVLSAFDPIAQEFGYDIDDVVMHHRGHVVTYRGSTYLITLGFDPEVGSPLGRPIGPR